MPHNIFIENEAREVFIEDTKAKSLVARSARTRVTKKKDDLSKYKNMNGVVVVSSLYDTIMPYREFQMLSKADRLKTLEGYERAGKTRQEIAEAWGKKVQAVHDLTYRLKRELGKLEKPTPIKEEKSAPVEVNNISPCSIKLIRSMNGDRIKEWVLKIIDIVEGDHLRINLDIKKQSKSDPSRFAFSVQLIDEYTAEELLSEVTNVAGMLGKDQYQVSFELIELPKQEQKEKE